MMTVVEGTPILAFPRQWERDFCVVRQAHHERNVAVGHPHPNLPPSRGKGHL